jgi:hypothetical protein
MRYAIRKFARDAIVTSAGILAYALAIGVFDLPPEYAVVTAPIAAFLYRLAREHSPQLQKFDAPGLPEGGE